MKLLPQSRPGLSWHRAAPFAGAAAVVGVVVVVLVRAAGPLAAFEPELGNLSGGATQATVTGASAGKAVQFNAAATPTPTPTPTATPTPGGKVKPDLTNTGARSATRTNLPALTTASSPTIVSGTPGNPTIIRDKHFTSANFTFNGHDVQFINCLFEGSTSDQLIEIHDSTPANQSIQFIDSTIQFAQPNGQHPLGLIGGIKLIRTLINNGDHAIHGINDDGYVYVDSSILDARPTSDNASSLGDPHGNAIYTTDGPAPNVVFVNTVFYGGNSQVIFDHAAQGNGKAIDGWVFDGDWFYGNNRNSNWAAENAIFSSGSSAANAFKNVRVRNSRFQRTGTGLNNLLRTSSSAGLTFAEWSNNVWDDNGQALPQPAPNIQ